MMSNDDGEKIQYPLAIPMPLIEEPH